MEVDTGVCFTLPVSGDQVELLERVEEMLCMVFADVFGTKIINNEAEEDRAPFEVPKAIRCFSLVITCGIEMFLKQLVDKDTGLG